MKYFVVYQSGLIQGMVNVITKKIKSFEDIKRISQYISEVYCENKPVIILNWKRYK